MSLLDDKLKNIEARLSRVERELKIRTEKKPETESPTFWEPAWEETKPKTKIVKSEPLRPGSWLGVMAVICFILAAGFIIKLSIESGWLTHARQIGLSYLFGLSLIVTGFVIKAKDSDYASLLPATGVIVLYLTTFAAHQYYFLISFTFAITITTVVSAFCVGLYLKFKHDAYAIVAAVGSYVSPVFMGFNENAIFTLYYFIPVSFAFAVISIWIQSRTLTMIAAYLAILVNALVGFNINQNLLLAEILPLHFIIFSIGTYLYTVHTGKMLTEKESWSCFPVLMLFYAMEYYFLDLVNSNFAPWIALAFAAFLIVLYLWARTSLKNKNLGSQSMILAFASIVIFHAFYLELLPTNIRPWLFVVIVLGIALIPDKFYAKKNFSFYAVPVFALFAILGIEYLSMLLELIQPFVMRYFIVAIVSVISIWVLFLTKRDDIRKSNEEYGYGVLATAHILAITALYQLTQDYNTFTLSAAWLFYAVCVITLGFTRKDKVIANSALIVLSFAAAKVLLYDVGAAPTIVRILCLLLTGGVLYGSGLLFRKIADWK